MTDNESAPVTQFDTGPLSWVIGEIRDALDRSATALREAADGPDAQSTLLLHAKTHLHQAHGALQMVDIAAVEQLTESGERVIDRIRDGALALDAARVDTIAEVYRALVEYLEELLAGAAPQPVRLFPYYQSLQEMLGVDRAHPGALLVLDPAPRLPGSAAQGMPDYAAARTRFEKALLPFLKSADEAQRAHALAMRDALAPIVQAHGEPRAHAFWLALHTVADLVASSQVPADLYLKQLIGQINLLLRRMSQGHTELPDALLRDALFFVAAAPEPTPDARLLRAAWGLDGQVPPDWQERRYGRVDPNALRDARQALIETKEGWDRIASEGPAAARDGAFREALSKLAGASEQLGAPALAQLLRELGQAASKSLAGAHNDQFSLEMATAMLFVEHGLDQLRELPDEFGQHAGEVGQRLLALAQGQDAAQAPQWQGELARALQQGQTVAVLADEIRASLRQVEKLIEEFHQDPSRADALAQVDPLLHQLHGALAILDQSAAMRAVDHARSCVTSLASGNLNPSAHEAVITNLAHNISALGFFTDALAQNVDLARRRYRFDDVAFVLREQPLDGAGAEPEAAAAAVAEPVAEPAAEPEPEPAPVPQAPAAPAHGHDEVEAELLEIFISEAHEVLELVARNLPAAHAAPGDQETLTRLRRAFHTLKGSSRMVGLERFALGAAAVEKLMNAWLSEARAATPDLLALLDHAHAEMSSWVAELAQGQGQARNADALVQACERVLNGEAFALPEAAVAADGPAPEPEPAPALPDNVLPFPQAEDNIKRIGSLEIPLPLYNIYLGESKELLHALDTDFADWRARPERPASGAALKAAHTLAGTSATVGFQALREIAALLEETLEAAGAPLAPEQHALLEETLERLRIMLQVFGLGELAPAQPELLTRLAALRDLLGQSRAEGVADAVLGQAAALLDDLFAATYESILADPPVAGGLPAPSTAAPVDGAVARTAPSHASDPAVAEVDDLFDSYFDEPFGAPSLEQAQPAAETAPAPAPAPAPGGDAFDVDALFDLPAAPAASEALAEALAEPPPAISEPEAELPVAADLPTEPVFVDELDPDLLPVFLEEGADLLPQIGNALREWQRDPGAAGVAQGLLRALHTVKGSARMAGAMRLGQHTHALETQVENMVHAGTTNPAAFDELLANYDQALLLFEQLRAPDAPDGAAAPQPQADAPGRPAAQPSAAQTPLVRVRADILDRLVNQAGEVSITRSKLETQVGTLKAALGDFSDNLARLRRQLREVDMQAESQIASRMSIAGERGFDPLEFDRFTRLQELTRMMAESVDDVASFHDLLTRTVDGANEDLAAQSRLTRELQRDLMRARMVPFASLAERLFRVARQTAKETDKRVNLDIRGGAVEIDRGVLERMAAPFEHLLRNAIVHGIETRARRGQAGKAEIGELLVQVSQQGNEVAIRFADDGAGLDLERIRAKGRASGLLAEDASVSDDEAADLIFAPGFSTADALTELAGRGVGMDVVRSEARALGGRVAVESAPGRGAAFTIHLPLTLAVTQVVLVASGARTHALPANLVEQLLQVREADLAAARAAGTLAVQGEAVALHYLPSLLGEPAGAPAGRSCPVLVLRSGAARLAVQVDAVLGNREVVVKNIGPQLARMPGIAGATVLGSGEVVLILDPVQLAAQAARAGAAPAAPEPAEPQAAPEPQAHAASVMVVDDSLTVRKVTQRLLEREGYRVLLAKDGVDALEQMQGTRPDLMLVDIEMPRMDGFDLTRNVRGNDATRGIPIVMITSRTADKHRNVALELGVDAYFGKPFQEDVLLAAIAGLLGRAMPAA